MRILNAKLRGLGTTPETGWFTLDNHLTTIHLKDPAESRAFIAALQSLNPPYNISLRQPFAKFPKKIEQHGYTKEINPAKRTIALAVFSSTPDLVRELAELTPVFYETDRIEIGRRLDYTPWLNFVELPSSSRWSDIATEFNQLRKRCDQHSSLYEQAEKLYATDDTERVTGALFKELIQTLNQMHRTLPPSCHQLIDSIRAQANRSVHFIKARTIVRTRMPLTICATDYVRAVIKPTNNQSNTLFKIPFQHDDQLLNTLKTQDTSLAEALFHAGRKHGFFGEVERCDFRDNSFSFSISSKPSSTESRDPALTALKLVCGLVSAASQLSGRMSPVLLFDSPENIIPHPYHDEMIRFLEQLSGFHQCLIVHQSTDPYPETFTAARFSGDQLIIGR